MLVYLICYIVSFILAWQHIYVLSGLVLLGAAVWAGFNYSSLVAVYKGLYENRKPNPSSGTVLSLFCGRTGNLLL